MSYTYLLDMESVKHIHITYENKKMRSMQKRVPTQKEGTEVLFSVMCGQNKRTFRKKILDWSKAWLEIQKTNRQRWICPSLWEIAPILGRSLNDPGTCDSNGDFSWSKVENKRVSPSYRRGQGKQRHKQPCIDDKISALKVAWEKFTKKEGERWTLCVNFICSVGQEVESSEDIYSAIDVCVQSKSKSTPEKSYSKDSLTGSCQNSHSGTTSPPLTPDHGKEWWTLFAEDSPVKISHAQEKVQESKGKDQGYGAKWHGSLMRYDHNMHLWKTAQHSLLEGLDVFLGTWPKWGMMLDGECWEQMTLERHIKGKGSGYWPTPDANMGKRGTQPEWTKKRKSGHHACYTINQAVRDKEMYPTPLSRDYKSPAKKTRLERTGSKSGENLPQVVGGKLNPNWVEWLMGWPIEWTDLKPLETDKFQEWLSLHGKY